MANYSLPLVHLFLIFRVFTYLPLLRLQHIQKPLLKCILHICHMREVSLLHLPFSLSWHATQACHSGSQSERPREMTFLPLPCSSLFPFDSRVPQLPPTAKWAPFVTFIFLLQHLNGNREHLHLLPLTGTVTRLWLIR